MREPNQVQAAEARKNKEDHCPTTTTSTSLPFHFIQNERMLFSCGRILKKGFELRGRTER